MTFNNYPIIVKNFFDVDIHKKICNFLEKNIKYFPLQEDFITFNRKEGHNVPFFVSIHNQLTDIASYYFNEKVKPSYSFLSMYKENGICPLHIDRDQCRYTIDYLISSTQEMPWPIHIGKHMTDQERLNILIGERARPIAQNDVDEIMSKEVFTSALLNPNDAVLYSGTHQWHYRSEKLVGEANLVFFHFVPESYNGSLN
jgi:hypothetical protein